MPVKPKWPPRPPADVKSADAKLLFKRICADIDEVGLIANAVEIALIHRVCRIEDQISVLRAALDAGDLESVGSTGQPILTPLIAELRNQTALQATILGKLAGVLEPPAEKAPKTTNSTGTTNRFAAAALVRWGSGG